MLPVIAPCLLSHISVNLFDDDDDDDHNDAAAADDDDDDDDDDESTWITKLTSLKV